MSDITRTKDRHTGEIKFKLEWEDNDGVTRERFFSSRNAAERHALNSQIKLINELVQSLITGPSPGQTKAAKG